MSDGTRLHAIVHGNVQGVFFRANTQRKANELGLVGWVKNLPGSRVEVVAEGERKSLDQLLLWLHKGPPSATVDKVDFKWKNATGEFGGFNIRYGW